MTEDRRQKIKEKLFELLERKISIDEFLRFLFLEIEKIEEDAKREVKWSLVKDQIPEEKKPEFLRERDDSGDV